MGYQYLTPQVIIDANKKRGFTGLGNEEYLKWPLARLKERTGWEVQETMIIINTKYTFQPFT